MARVWALVDTQALAGLPDQVHVGLAVTSHLDGTSARAFFSGLAITPTSPPPHGELPPGWTGANVGSPAAVGAARVDGDTYTVQGSGADISETADSFRYTYRTFAGDGTIVARVAAFDGVHPWSKAGVMIRASLDPAAAHGFMLLSRDNGLAVQRRTDSGAATTHTGAGAGTAPVWRRLTRSGSTITAAWSPDGSSWIDVGSDTLAIGSGPVLVGLALTSHDDAALATATFDQVVVTP